MRQKLPYLGGCGKEEGGDVSINSSTCSGITSRHWSRQETTPTVQPLGMYQPSLREVSVSHMAQRSSSLAASRGVPPMSKKVVDVTGIESSS
jgi:hypothetical protein